MEGKCKPLKILDKPKLALVEESDLLPP